MRSPAFVCLYVCLLARLLKNACMDLDEILRADRRRDMEELVNLWARSRSQSGCRNRKIDDLSKSVKQAPHSKQATGHMMHRREILFTPRCSSTAREFRGSVDFSVRRTIAKLPNFRILDYFPPYKTSLQPMGYVAEWLRFFHVVVERELWSLLMTYRKSYMAFLKNPLFDL